MVVIADFISLAKNFGLFEFYLPFILCFALFYGLLLKSKIFGDTKASKNVSVLISFVAAFYLMAFTPVGVTLTTFFAQFFGSLATVLITFLAFLMIIALLTPGEPQEKLANYLRYLIPIGILFVFGIFIYSGGLNMIFPGGVSIGVGISAEDILIVIFLVVTALVFWWMVRGGEGEEKKGEPKGWVYHPS